MEAVRSPERHKEDEPETVMVAPAEKVAPGVAKGAFTRAKNALTSYFQNGLEDSVTLAARNQLD